MSKSEYIPLKFCLDPNSIPRIVAHIQRYLETHPIISEDNISEIISEYIQEHPEVIEGYFPVSIQNGGTGATSLAGAKTSLGITAVEDQASAALTAASAAQTSASAAASAASDAQDAADSALESLQTVGEQMEIVTQTANSAAQSAADALAQVTGTVKSVNAQLPDNTGELALTASNIPSGAVTAGNTVFQDLQALGNLDAADIPSGVTTPGTTVEGDLIALDNELSSLSDSLVNVESDITSLESSTVNKIDIAIMANGDTHSEIGSGQFVYIKNHGSLADGLYCNSTNQIITSNQPLTTSNVSPVTNGALNVITENSFHAGSSFTWNSSINGGGATTNFATRVGKIVILSLYFEVASSINGYTKIIGLPSAVIPKREFEFSLVHYNSGVSYPCYVNPGGVYCRHNLITGNPYVANVVYDLL